MIKNALAIVAVAVCAATLFAMLVMPKCVHWGSKESRDAYCGEHPDDDYYCSHPWNSCWVGSSPSIPMRKSRLECTWVVGCRTA